MRRILIPLVSSLMWTAVAAQAAEESAPPPPPVDVPVEEGPVEPQITIVEEEGRVIYEYRSSEGKLYMVKIVPRGGKPYFLLDTNGDGELDVREDDPRNVAVQLWELFRW